MQLKHRIGAVMNMSKSVTRRSLGDRHGTFRGNVRAGLSRLDRKLDDRDDSIDILRQKTHAEMNDPRRTSGDGISGIIDAVPERISVLNDLGQFLGLLRLKRKSSIFNGSHKHSLKRPRNKCLASWQRTPGSSSTVAWRKQVSRRVGQVSPRRRRRNEQLETARKCVRG